MPRFTPLISSISKLTFSAVSFSTAWYGISDYHTKKHEAARCLFHVCLGGEPGLRNDVVQQYSGSSSCYLHLLYDTLERLKASGLMQDDASFTQARDSFLQTLHASKFYHHYSSGPLFYPMCDESAIVRRLKYHALRFRLMYDLWVKRTDRFIVPMTTVYKVDPSPLSRNGSSSATDEDKSTLAQFAFALLNQSQEQEPHIMGHRSYLVLERDSNQILLFDTSQLQSFPSPHHKYGPHRRLIAMRFKGVDFNSLDTINELARIYTYDMVPMHSRDVASEDDNDVTRIVRIMHERLNPQENLEVEPQFIRKGQLYGTCSYSPFEKMISVWFPKEQGKVLKRHIRQEIFDRYSHELARSKSKEDATLTEYVLQKAKASVL